MIKIKNVPIGYPAKQANSISIRVMPFQTTDKSCSTYYELVNSTTTVDDEGKETESVILLAEGNSPITEEQFLVWAQDMKYIEDIVLENLNLERL